MRLAVMQPYFLPYLGYWQLIQACDVFMLGDDFQYMRGWVNRNRFLRQDGGWFYLSLPLQKHGMRDPIKNVLMHPQADLTKLLTDALTQYRFRRPAPYFDEIFDLLIDTAGQIHTRELSRINEAFIRSICAYLAIPAEIRVMSQCGFDFIEEQSAGERMVRLCQFTHATEFLIPVGGSALYNAAAFKAEGCELLTLRCNDIVYPQRQGFESSLSIVDVLMFNGRDGTSALLDAYTLKEAVS